MTTSLNPTPERIAALFREVVSGLAIAQRPLTGDAKPDTELLRVAAWDLVDLVLSPDTDQGRRDAVATLVGKAAEHSFISALTASTVMKTKNVHVTPQQMVASTNKGISEMQKERD